MRTLAPRLLWALAGLATIVGIAVPGTHLIIMAGVSGHSTDVQLPRTFSVSGTITGVTVQSNGDPVRVTAGDVRQVRVSELLDYDSRNGGPPRLEQTVSHGHLTLGDPACYYSDFNCDVTYSVTVPPGVSATVASYGGDVTVSGTAGADVDSYGGSVTATRIAGPLTVSTGGGDLRVNGLTGPLIADTYGGTLTAYGVASGTATAITEGGDTRMVFIAAPDTVMVSTDEGAATLTVPGGPYALTTSDDQGGTWVRIPTSPAADRVITVNTAGGPILIRPLPDPASW
jgi:hypothetical protein